ncbi:hypothetical protein DNH61_25530 [Paenibacillus sambharensis]|uniref:Uncharacterized protein n=1 Tax=Paenibacillus sambharensis TaxID=1803190 RepID=A0A2W1L1N3_9BACL|nr:hypothetical protein [Paenibacillus sambharensis]PZD92963.1 hypothetical protein DNH61_25530 [Paenibacillus sambharensis]
MKIIFEADSGMERKVARVTTNPAEEQWAHIRKAISGTEKKIKAINASNDRQVQIHHSLVAGHAAAVGGPA